MTQLASLPADPIARFSVRLKELLPSGSAFSSDAALNALARARGHQTASEILAFKSDRPPLQNPFPSIPTSDIALRRLQQAVGRKETVVVLGDYDVDGIVSTVLMFEVLRRAGLSVKPFIPDRIEDDYGVTQKAVDKCVAEHAPRLIISVDCGSTSVGVIAGLKERGVDFIVLDHHEPGACSNGHPALAHLNPKAWKDHSPLVDEAASLCAGGLVFFFAEYLAGHLPAQDWRRDRSLILAGIATVADVMPLTRTNRALVKHSVALAARPEGRALVPGVSLLLERASAADFTAKTYGWVIGPHLNAAGRVTHARISANLVASSNPETMAKIVDELIATNRERKAVQERVQDEAMEQAEEQMALNPGRKFLALFGREWHPGVVGIVAGRVRERFLLPTIVCGLHPEGGYWKGSARSVRGGNLGAIVHAAVEEGVLLGGGGHHMAAGIRLSQGREEEFRLWLEAHTAQMVWDTEEVLEVLGPYAALKPDVWGHLLEVAGPFGNSSPEPVMLLQNAVLSGAVRRINAKRTGRPFGLTFDLTENGRSYRLSWLGLSNEGDLAAAEEFLQRRQPGTFAVRQTTSSKDGVTYTNLEIAGLPRG